MPAPETAMPVTILFLGPLRDMAGRETIEVAAPLDWQGLLDAVGGDEGAKAIIKKYRNLVNALNPNFINVDIDTKSDFDQLSKGKFN